MSLRSLPARSETNLWPSPVPLAVLFGIGGLVMGVYLYDLALELKSLAYPLWVLLAENVPGIGLSAGILAIGTRAKVKGQIYRSEAAKGCLVGFAAALGTGLFLLGLRQVRGGAAPMVYMLVSAGTFAGTLVGYFQAEGRRVRQELRSITENVSEGIYRSTPDEGPIYANQAFADMFGYGSVEEVLQVDPASLYPDPSNREELLERTSRQGGLQGEEVQFQRADGSVFTGRVTDTIVREDDGEVAYCDGVISDVTEQKRRQQKLRESRRELRKEKRRVQAITENVSEGIYRSTREEGIVYANRAFIEMFGYEDLEELKAAETGALYVDPARREELVKKEAEQGTLDREEVQFRRKDGTTFIGLLSTRQVEGEEPGKTYFDGAITDITERKKREEALRKTKGQYQTLIENFPDGGAYLFDEDLRYRLAGGEKIGVVGEPEEIIGKTVFDLLPEELAEEQARCYRRALEGERSDFEQEYEGRYYRVQTIPVRSESGEVISGMVVSQDITKRKQQKERLERQNDLFQRAQEIANVGAWEYDTQTGWGTMTNQAYRIYGLKPDVEKTTDQTISLYHPEDRPVLREAFTRATEEGEPYDLELRLTPDDGTRRWVRVRGEPQREDGEVARVRGTIQDITEQKEREQALRERQEKIEALYEATGKLLRAESRREVPGHLVDIIGNALGYPATTVRLAKDGRLKPTRVPKAVQDHMPERPAYEIDGDTPAAEAYRSGESRVYDDLSVRAEELDRGDIRATAYVPIGAHGLISVGCLEVGGIDAFDRRLLEVLGAYSALVLGRLGWEEELIEAKREAEQASRMKSSFLANMSHEIRTPLTSIIGFAEALGSEAAELDLPEGSPLPQHATLIEQGGKRLLETLEGVLNLSKLEAGQMELSEGRVDLATEAGRTAEELRSKAREKGVGLEVQTQQAQARADEGGVQIVARNLLSNAIKYTEEGGTVWFRTYREDGRAVLEVEDTGVGMEPDEAESLFEPFRQASEGWSREYEGTGVGLAVTKKATEQMGGSVEVETQKGEGSRFTVRLPPAKGASAEGAPAEGSSVEGGSGDGSG